MNETENIECVVTGNELTKNENRAENIIIRGIYGLRCQKTNKWYIGQSSDIHKRFGDYKGLRCKNQRKLYFALCKYGYDNFDKVILEIINDSDWIIDYREMYWIRYFVSIENGYNLAEGGKVGIGFLGRKHTDETRKKMSEWQIGRKFSKETIQNISKSLSGIKWTDELREKIMIGKRNMSDDKKLMWKKKIGMSAKGRKPKPMSNETKMKLSESLIGKNTGSNNPAFGKRWITNGIVNRFMDKNLPIEDGWRTGVDQNRKLKVG